jgi:hydrogenase-1 operon protein HyaF
MSPSNIDPAPQDALGFGPDEVNRPNPLRWRNEQPMEGVFLNPAGQDGLTLLDLPQGVKPKRRILLSNDAAASDALKALVANMLAALRTIPPEADSIVFDVSQLSASDASILSEILGDGEVSIVAGPEPLTQVSESTLAGVWRVRAESVDGQLAADRVEIGAIPRLVREINLAGSAVPAPLPDALDDGVMNAPPVIAEVAARALEWTPGVPNHVINFTLMPMTPQDTALITHCLGQAPMLILSTGYGACRVVSSAIRHVWAVQYMSSVGAIILDTLEVGDVPNAALAAREDFEDSAVRLAEIMAAYL